VAELDWWRPFDEPGRTVVQELLDPEAWQRYFAADPGMELDLGRVTLADQLLDLRARRLIRSIRSGDQTLAELDLSGPPDFTGGWEKTFVLLGTPGRVVRRTDDDRPSRLRGALRYLELTAGDRSWVWHFEGGRAAGERLVLRAGDRPAAGEPLVVTHPSAMGRSLGRLTGGATADTRVVTWSAAATPADVVVAELCATAKLDNLVDYRANRIAEGFSELLDHLPRAEPGTE
jgi:hypothetical protein